MINQGVYSDIFLGYRVGVVKEDMAEVEVTEEDTEDRNNDRNNWRKKIPCGDP